MQWSVMYSGSATRYIYIAVAGCYSVANTKYLNLGIDINGSER
jgi:hypothetical protein